MCRHHGQTYTLSVCLFVCMNDNSTTCVYKNEWNLCKLLMWTFSRPLCLLLFDALAHSHSCSTTVCLSANFTILLLGIIFRFRLRILWCDIPKSKRRIFYFVLYLSLVLRFIYILMLSCSRCTSSVCWYTFSIF